MDPLRVFASCLLLAGLFTAGEAILCYQCNSTDLDDPYQCREILTDDVDILPKSCSEVYNAAYCIKHTGRFEGFGLCLCTLPGDCILCYQCFAPNNTDCTDMLIHDLDGISIKPSSCDHVFEARYCIKATGAHAGGIGTRRYCSSVDMGNYCNYIKQPGDVREYRSCVFTCSSDGCNHSTDLVPPSLFLLLLLGLSL